MNQGLWERYEQTDRQKKNCNLRQKKNCNLRGLKMSEVNESVQKTWISGTLKKGA